MSNISITARDILLHQALERENQKDTLSTLQRQLLQQHRDATLDKDSILHSAALIGEKRKNTLPNTLSFFSHEAIIQQKMQDLPQNKADALFLSELQRLRSAKIGFMREHSVQGREETTGRGGGTATAQGLARGSSIGSGFTQSSIVAKKGYFSYADIQNGVKNNPLIPRQSFGLPGFRGTGSYLDAAFPQQKWDASAAHLLEVCQNDFKKRRAISFIESLTKPNNFHSSFNLATAQKIGTPSTGSTLQRSFPLPDKKRERKVKKPSLKVFQKDWDNIKGKQMRKEIFLRRLYKKSINARKKG